MTGRCIGGPYDGEIRHGREPEWRVHNVDGRYRWNDFGAFWNWEKA